VGRIFHRDTRGVGPGADEGSTGSPFFSLRDGMMVVTVRKVSERCAILGTGQWPDSSRLGA